MKNKILVIVRGGLVQEVRALSPDNLPAVMILDADGLDNKQFEAASAQALQVFPVTVEQEDAETDAIGDQEPAAVPVIKEHTRGAVKVAKALTGYEYEEAKTIETPAGYKTCKGIADMIDQETGARELLATIEILQEAFIHVPGAAKNNKIRTEAAGLMRDALNTARAVVNKYKGDK